MAKGFQKLGMRAAAHCSAISAVCDVTEIWECSKPLVRLIISDMLIDIELLEQLPNPLEHCMNTFEDSSKDIILQFQTAEFSHK